MLVYLNQSLAQAIESVARQFARLELAKLQEAIARGASQRVRPIIMTVASIVVGLVPPGCLYSSQGSFR